MTAGYGDGPDIITSCSINVNQGRDCCNTWSKWSWKIYSNESNVGLLKLKSGTVAIDGNDISKLSPQDRVKKGISFVPQTRNVFTELTVKKI